jgi:hypothetical protein
VTEPDPKPNAKVRSSRGKWTVVAMFVLGGAVLVGLFLAPRPKSPSAPTNVTVGVPDPPLNFVVCDLGTGGPSLSPEAIAGDIAGQEVVPDYLILFHVSLEDAAAIAAQFGMQDSYDPRLGQKLRPADAGGERITTCILSRHALYDAEPLKDSTNEPYGIRAWSAVGGKKFLVAGALATGGQARAFADSCKAIGAPPTVAGILVDAAVDSTPTELESEGFSIGRGLPADTSSKVHGRWRPRLIVAGPWQYGGGGSWDIDNARIGVCLSLAGRPAESPPATGATTRPPSDGN